jgi:alpha-L-fucosidase
LLLLNVPPNREGLFAESDIASLSDFRRILDETFKTNLVAKQPKLTDKQLATFTTVSANQPVTIDLTGEQSFDRISIQENIANGQRIASGRVEYWNGSDWRPIQSFTTVGYKRLLRFPAVKSSKLRLFITNANGPVELAEVGVYKASSGEEN